MIKPPAPPTPRGGDDFLIVEIPLHDHRRVHVVRRLPFEDGVQMTLAAYSLVRAHEVGLRVQLTAVDMDAEIDAPIRALEGLADAGELKSE